MLRPAVVILLSFFAIPAFAEEKFPTATPILSEVRDICGAKDYIAFLGTKDAKPVAYIVERSASGLLQKAVELVMHDTVGMHCTDKTVELIGFDKEGDEHLSRLTYTLQDNTSTVDSLPGNTDTAAAQALYNNDGDSLVAGGRLTRHMNGTISYAFCCENRLELAVRNIQVPKSGDTALEKDSPFRHWVEVLYIEHATGRVLNRLLIAKEEGKR